MVVEPLRHVPAHGYHAPRRVRLHVVHGVVDNLGREALPAVAGLSVCVVELDRIAVDAVVGERENLAVHSEGVAAGIRLVSDDLRHGSRVLARR